MSDGNGVAAAERLALEQEMNALRRALADRDRAMDDISEECRRMEDVMEDQHRVADRLRRDLDQRDAALLASQQSLVAVERERDALRGRLAQEPERRGGSRYKRQRRGGTVMPFLGGIFVGLVVAAVISSISFNFQEVLAPLGIRPTTERPSSAGKGRAAADEDGNFNALNGHQAIEPAPTLSDRLADGSSGPLLSLLPAGAFTMGTPAYRGKREEQPEHQVQVKAFLMGTNEVTFAEYDHFARATGRRLPSDFGWGRGKRPVVDVTWEDANAYVQWLSRETGHKYRLPSEAEWEYAARAGTHSAYWWGYFPEPGRAVCFDCGTSWDGRSTAPVGSFDPNPFGLYDTAGNAMEWTADCYHPDYDGAPTDGSAWDSEECESRAVRGGAFNKIVKIMRSAARSDFSPETRIDMLGFRVARDE